jgi:hypothetical protein
MVATAFFAKSSKATNKGKGKGKWNQEDKSKKYCNHCKITGHKTSECWKLKKEQKAKAANGANTCHNGKNNEH